MCFFRQNLLTRYLSVGMIPMTEARLNPQSMTTESRPSRACVRPPLSRASRVSHGTVGSHFWLLEEGGIE